MVATSSQTELNSYMVQQSPPLFTHQQTPLQSRSLSSPPQSTLLASLSSGIPLASQRSVQASLVLACGPHPIPLTSLSTAQFYSSFASAGPLPSLVRYSVFAPFYWASLRSLGFPHSPLPLHVAAWPPRSLPGPRFKGRSSDITIQRPDFPPTPPTSSSTLMDKAGSFPSLTLLTSDGSGLRYNLPHHIIAQFSRTTPGCHYRLSACVTGGSHHRSGHGPSGLHALPGHHRHRCRCARPRTSSSSSPL